MSEIHLRQPRFTNSAWRPVTKNKERTEKFKETWDWRYIYQNKVDKACFQQDNACGDFKDLSRRTVAYNVLRDKAFNIAKFPIYDRYQRGLASMVYTFFDKKTAVGAVKNEVTQNEKLAEQLQKPINRKFEKRKVHSSFIYNIWGADLADM